MLSKLLLIYGFLFSLPLIILNVLPFGLKLDDLVMMVILFFLVIFNFKSGVRINKYILLFISVSAFFSILAFLNSSINIKEYMGDNSVTVFLRVIQSLLIILLFSMIYSNPVFLGSIYKGFIFGSSISLIIFLYYLAIHIDLSKFIDRGVYFTKDIFQYTDDTPFTVHVNTLGSFFLISFFLIFFKSNTWIGKLTSFIFLLPSFLLIAKGDLVAIFVFFMCLYLGKSKVRRLYLYGFISSCLVFFPVILSFYSSLREYRVYTSERDGIYLGAFYRIFENPFGYGLGSQNNIIYDAVGVNFPAHNIFLSIGLEFGWFYLFFVMTFLFLCFFKSKKIDNKNKLVFICYLIIGLFGNAMYFYKYHTVALTISMLSLWGGAQYERMLYIKQKRYKWAQYCSAK
ncbi:Uncharacterised protein [Yersinia kristensenii]|nr:Uncharacterised protein [Yersinia kristensenii]